MADMTSYLNDARAKLGNEAAVNRAYPNYYNLDGNTVKEIHAPDGGHFDGGNFHISRLVASHPFASVPDSIASTLKLVLDRKIHAYNLNKGISTPKP